MPFLRFPQPDHCPAPTEAVSPVGGFSSPEASDNLQEDGGGGERGRGGNNGEAAVTHDAQFEAEGEGGGARGGKSEKNQDSPLHAENLVGTPHAPSQSCLSSKGNLKNAFPVLNGRKLFYTAGSKYRTMDDKGGNDVNYS